MSEEFGNLLNARDAKEDSAMILKFLGPRSKSKQQSNRKEDIAVDALKRFADSLQADDAESKRLLYINQKRINDFLDKNVAGAKSPTSSSLQQPKFKIPGVFSYDEPKSKTSLYTQMENTEISKDLGFRSKFGDGDGSYWDKWLNNDSTNTERINSEPPRLGFKKVYNSELMFGSAPVQPFNLSSSSVKPYALRHMERKMRESGNFKEEEEAFITAVGGDVQAAFEQELSKTKLPVKDELKLPKISVAEKETYFGDRARVSFFDFYRQVTRQLYSVEDPHHIENVIADRNFKDKKQLKADESKDSIRFTPKAGRISFEDGYSATPKRSDGLDHALKSNSISVNKSGNGSSLHDLLNLEAEMPVHNEFSDHLDLASAAGAAAKYHPVSPRTKFVVNCIANEVNPKPHLIIRKSLDPILNLKDHGFGDKLAGILANSLADLPYLNNLNVSGNNLTDVGLSALIKSLCECDTLSSLDLSSNRLGMKSSEALLEYLSHPNCKLAEIYLSKANLTDKAAKLFLKAVSKCKTLNCIDISENNFGTHVLQDVLNPLNEDTGTIIGELIGDESCKHLKKLMLGWNRIRGSCGLKIAESLKTNNSLLYLDLAYNKLGDEGGQALGSALFHNTTLQYLNVSSNDIRPKAAFVLAAAVHRCVSLTTLLINENPIGDVGTKALMKLQFLLDRQVEVEMKDCAFKVQDPACKFNYERFVGNYSIDVSNVYGRAVCFEVLRAVAEFQHEVVESLYIVDRKTKSKIEVKLNVIEKPLRLIPEQQLLYAELLQQKLNYNWNDAERISKLFKTYSSNGSLRRADLIRLLKELGLIGNDDTSDPASNGWNFVRDIFEIYDIDGSGVIHEKEFMEFVSKLGDELENKLKRFETKRFIAAEGSLVPYEPPEDCVVEFNVNIREDSAPFLLNLSRANVSNLLSAVKAAVEGTKLMHYALDGVELGHEEAFALYEILLKELGDKVAAILKLLPRMKTSAEACSLLTLITNDDVDEKTMIRHRIWNCYRAFCGKPNGFYKLKLLNENDHMCLKKLVDLSFSWQRQRQKLGLGDVSQNGDWQCFRNVVLDGVKCILTPKWLERVPQFDGCLEFDFACFPYVSPREAYVDDSRLCNLLARLGLIDSPSSVLSGLVNDSNYVNDALLGNLVYKRWEMDSKQAIEVFKKEEWCYENFENRDADAAFSFESLQEGVVQSAASGIGSSVYSANPSRVRRTGSVAHNDMSPRASPKGFNDVEPSIPKHSPPQTGRNPRNRRDDGRKSKTYGAVLRSLQDIGVIEKEIFVMRCIDALEDMLAGKYITCTQLAVIARALPYGSMKRNNFGTFRVELIVLFSSKIIDMVNFERIFKILSTGELGALFFRLGWLNLWSPVKADGTYFLNLSRREDRVVLRIMMTIAALEKGEGLQYATFESADSLFVYTSTGEENAALDLKSGKRGKQKALLSSFAEEESNSEFVNVPICLSSDETFKVPELWHTEDGFPIKGFYKFSYGSLIYSSQDANLRISLATLTSPRLVVSSNAVVPTTARAESYLGMTGYRLSFNPAHHRSVPFSVPVHSDYVPVGEGLTGGHSVLLKQGKSEFVPIKLEA